MLGAAGQDLGPLYTGANIIVLTMELLFVALLAIVFGAFSSTVAGNKGYNSGTWALAGLFFGPIGFFAALGLPDLKQRKYLRLLLEHYGVSENSTMVQKKDDLGDADAQRRRILGGK